MNRANPTDMRRPLMVVEEFKKHDILFVPIPVLNEDDHLHLVNMMNDRLLSLMEEK